MKPIAQGLAGIAAAQRARNAGEELDITERDLPGTIARSPKKVQRTYAKTLDSAHEQYDSEERAHRTAYASVKHIAENGMLNGEVIRLDGAIRMAPK